VVRSLRDNRKKPLIIGIDEFKQVQVQFPNGETQWMSVGLAKQLGATYSHSLMRKGV
jgi:hypothetical protein